MDVPPSLAPPRWHTLLHHLQDGTQQLVNRAPVYNDAQVMFVNSQSDPLTQLSMQAMMGWMLRLDASLAYTLDPASGGCLHRAR